MFFKKFSFVLGLLTVVALADNAKAITINGQEYKKILSVYSNQDFGYWPGPNKFFTFNNNDNYIKPVTVNRVDYRDNILAGVDFRQVFSMGTTAADGTVTNSQLSTVVNSGTVSLYGRNNVLLLTATLVSNGELDATYKSGTAGQLNVSGVYNITGGSLFTSGLITGSLFVDIGFDRVWQNEYKDLKTSWGTFTFYHLAGGTNGGTTGGTTGGTQIPEPASMSLLISGLLGSRLIRRKK